MNPQLPCRGESCEIDRYIILVCKLLWSTIEHISHITAWFLYLMYHVNLCYIYTYICTILRWQIQRIAYVMRPAAGTALADSRERGELQWIAVKTTSGRRANLSFFGSSSLFNSPHLSMSSMSRFSPRSVPSCSGEVGCPTRQVCTIVLCSCDSRHQINGEPRIKYLKYNVIKWSRQTQSPSSRRCSSHGLASFTSESALAVHLATCKPEAYSQTKELRPNRRL